MDRSTVWLPYCGPAPAPGELLSRWNFDPPLIAALLLGSMLWWWCLSGTRTERLRLLAASALLAVLFVSPLCALSSALFSSRAVHHLALTALAAPLLAGAVPRGSAPGRIALWTGLHAAIFWLWHAPRAYEAALSSDAVYWLMQLSLLLSAVALWRTVRQAPLPAGIAALLATMVQMGLLGALLTFIAAPLYAPHAVAPLAWGLTPLEDQQLAGLIMWAPGAGLYLAAAVALVARWFARERAAALPA